jgi:hypothetical protein
LAKPRNPISLHRCRERRTEPVAHGICRKAYHFYCKYFFLKISGELCTDNLFLFLIVFNLKRSTYQFVIILQRMWYSPFPRKVSSPMCRLLTRCVHPTIIICNCSHMVILLQVIFLSLLQFVFFRIIDTMFHNCLFKSCSL